MSNFQSNLTKKYQARLNNIINLYQLGFSVKQIASYYQVSHNSISRVITDIKV